MWEADAQTLFRRLAGRPSLPEPDPAECEDSLVAVSSPGMVGLPPYESAFTQIRCDS